MIVVALVILAAVGAVVRWKVGAILPRPAGTLLVNVAGAFLLAALVESDSGSDLAIGVGGLGSLTTFSTLVDDLHALWSQSKAHAIGYAAATLVLGVGAAWLGLQL